MVEQQASPVLLLQIQIENCFGNGVAAPHTHTHTHIPEHMLNHTQYVKQTGTTIWSVHLLHSWELQVKWFGVRWQRTQQNGPQCRRCAISSCVLFAFGFTGIKLRTLVNCVPTSSRCYSNSHSAPPATVSLLSFNNNDTIFRGRIKVLFY